MERWTYDRYRAPQLAVENIETGADPRTVLLHSGPKVYRLAFDDTGAAAEVAAQLATLRGADAPLWTMLRESSPDSPWRALATFLDSRSLIRECADESEQALGQAKSRAAELVAGTAAAILAPLSEERRAASARLAAEMLARLDRAAIAGCRFSFKTDVFDPAVQPNFYQALLAVEFDYLGVAAPVTLTIVESLLGHIAEPNGSVLSARANARLEEAAGLYDEHDLESHLWLIGQLLVASTGPDSHRLATAPLPEVALCSGLEFMRRTELVTRDTLELWGKNAYVAALDEAGEGAPLIAGPYIEQYHVTRRFVEIIAPLLSRRLGRPLRALAYRYYSEEVGHEELESATCESLGVTVRALDLAIPLPLHFAFVDALTQVARTDPIASFASIMVIEGVFGEPPRMSLRLAAVGAPSPGFLEAAEEHEELNDSLNHNSIARDAFECMAAVGPARQLEAMRKILFLLELNHRAWAGIAAFYGPQQRLVLNGRFGAPLDPQS